MFQKHRSCIPINKSHCRTNSDVGLYTHLQVYYTHVQTQAAINSAFKSVSWGRCRAVRASTSSATEGREMAAERAITRQRKLQNELVENGGSLANLRGCFLCCLTQWKRLLKFAFVVVCVNVGQGYTNISQPVNYKICPVKLFHIGEWTMFCHQNHGPV